MTQKMKELSFLNEQQSIPAKNLIEPAPGPDEIEIILQAAMSAPDHGQLQPFRFLIVQGEARHELSRVFEQAIKNRDPQADQATIDKQKNKPLRSPLIVVVVAKISDNPKIPQVEQVLSAGCAAQHIQLASRQLGYGSIWLTGDNCYDLLVHEALGLDVQESLIGFIYIGTPDQAFAKKSRASAKSITRQWYRAQHTEFAI